MVAPPASRPSPTITPPLPAAGIGWRHPHYRELLEQRPPLGFIEVHSENFFADGGAALALLHQAREHYALSLHGVGLSLGSAAALDDWHVQHLVRLVRQMQPWLVSEHAAYARGRPLGRDGAALHANDLLPIPFSRAALQALADHVDEVQNALGRVIAVENVSAYLVPPGGEELSEPEVEAGFLRELAERSGCLLLVDVNNLIVNALNRQRRSGVPVDPLALGRRWLAQVPAARVAEIHVAGHDASGPVVIDHHGCAVPGLVWQLYQAAITRFGQVPTLVERDNHIPPLADLLAEAAQADVLAAAAGAHQATTGHLAARSVRPLTGTAPSGSPRVPVAELERLAHGQGELLGWIRSAGPGAPPAPSTCPPHESFASEPMPMPSQPQPQPQLLSSQPSQPSPAAHGDEPAGLAVYRHNARGLTLRCLGAAYPVLHELVGDAAFAALAQAYWLAEPPTRGDLADWGASLADWLVTSGAQAGGLTADAPYLPDMARLEWALHRAELAGDAAANPASLALLGHAEPAELALCLAPACSLLTSAYPVADIWQAHRASGDHDADAGDDAGNPPGAGLADSRGDLLPGALGGVEPAVPVSKQPALDDDAAQQRGVRLAARLQAIAAAWSADAGTRRVLIWRPQWRARLRALDAGEAAFVQAVLDGASLAAALDAGLAAPAPLDFAHWLTQALRTGLLRGVRRLAG